ncbi:MAG: hypothetical protein KDA60_21790, partial [Planctomycetales bacterium]|nr:hypothetical protein [Planctomycetales bacterium]
ADAAWGHRRNSLAPFFDPVMPRPSPDAPQPNPSYPFHSGIHDHLESPVTRTFNSIERQLSESSQQEATQFDTLTDNLDRLQEAFDRQQRILEIERKLREQKQRELSRALKDLTAPALPDLSPPIQVEPPEKDTSLEAPAQEDTSRDSSGEVPTDGEPTSKEPVDIVPGVTNIPDEVATSLPESDNVTPPNDADTNPSSSSPQLGTNDVVDRGSFADNLFASGKHRLAAEMYMKQLQENLTPEQRAWTQFQLANCLRHLGDRSGAERQYRQVAAAQITTVYPAMARWWLSHLKQTSALSDRFSALKADLQSNLNSLDNQED